MRLIELPITTVPRRRSSPPDRVAAALATAACFGAVGAWERLRGFQAISDDDYARVTLAQRFAVNPHGDPSGTSWLPFPFWLNGTFLRWFGRSLAIAERSALLWAALAGLVLWCAGRMTGLSPRGAGVAATLPLCLPPVAVLCAATVPELPTAALVTFAIIAMSFGTPRQLILGGAAMAAACLSRYETWAVALFLAGVALRPTMRPAPDRPGARRVAAVLMLVGPLLWVIWNHHAHGDALHFARRVAAYHRSMVRPAANLPERLAGYPWAVLREGAVILVPALVLWSRGARAWRRTWMVPVLSMVVLVLGLVVAEIRGGAPTHHPERAVVTVWLLASLLLVRGAQPYLSRHSFRLSAIATVLLLAATVAFGWWRLPALRAGLGADRTAARAAGYALAQVTRPGDAILVVPEAYEYFAMLAAFGRPEDSVVVVTASFDPRGVDPDPFANETNWRVALASARPKWALLSDNQVPHAAALGVVATPLTAGWSLASVDGTRSP